MWSGEKYIPMFRGDPSEYKWFLAFPDTLAENPPTAIIDYFSTFGIQNGAVSNSSLHFMNETFLSVT